MGTQSATSYEDASAILRREVGSAIDELNQTKIDLVKFQAKSESEQFKQIQQAATEKDLTVFNLKAVKADPIKDPQKIIATLSPPPDAQKISAGELRLKLTDTQSGNTQTLFVSSLNGADIEVQIPADLLDRGIRTYRIEVQARNGTYTLRNAHSLTMDYAKIRFDIDVKGKGTVSYLDAANATVTCPADSKCNATKLRIGQSVTLTAAPVNPATQVIWRNAPGCGVQLKPPYTCSITPTADLEISAELKTP